MLAAGHRFEEFKLDFTLNLVSAEICGADLQLIPFECPTFWPLNFRLVDRGKLAWSDVSVDDEKAKSTFRERSHWVGYDDFSVGCRLHFFGRDDDAARLVHCALLVLQ